MTAPSGSRREIILASTSPRRKEILSLLGLPFRTVSPDFEEVLSEKRSIVEEVTGVATFIGESEDAGITLFI